MTSGRLLATILFFGSMLGRATADEKYYLLMFSAQRIPRNPNYAHTFATFVRSDAAAGVFEPQTAGNMLAAVDSARATRPRACSSRRPSVGCR